MINNAILKLINFFTFGYGVKKIHNQKNVELILDGASKVDHVSVEDNVVVHGTATLNKVFVGKTLFIHGSLSATDSTMQRLESNGYTVLKNCQIDETIIAQGFTQLTDCKTATIKIKGSLRAKGSSLQSILIQKSWPGKHVINLTDTIVQGDVIFENIIGSVVLKGNAHILGNVIGGTVKRV